MLLSEEQALKELCEDARQGLTSHPKELSPRWLYDSRGSALFEHITRLDAYYPTRTERAILQDVAPRIAARVRATTVCELGSGSSEKTELLLAPLLALGTLRSYAALDVSAPTLGAALERLQLRYPTLTLKGVVGDFERHLSALEGAGPRLFAFLGGTLGNLKPAARGRFYRHAHRALRPEDALLLGTDLLKTRTRLEAAYDDTEGVTAQFNLNVLRVLNRMLGAQFALSDFHHRAHFSETDGWVEMWLVAKRSHSVALPRLDFTLHLRRGEGLRTEVSTKFEPEGLGKELVAAGFREEGFWTDAAGDFALSLWRPLRDA